MGSRKGVPHTYSGNVMGTRARVRYGLTQWQMSILLNVSRQQVTAIERGKAVVDGLRGLVYEALIQAEGESFVRIKKAVTEWAETQRGYGRTIYKILHEVYGGENNDDEPVIEEAPRVRLPALRL